MKSPLIRRATLLAFALLTIPSVTHAAFDWPLDWELPQHDISIGLSGGMNFGEEGSGFNRGPLVGLSLSYHHEFLGIQAEFAGRREGLAQHLGGSLEVVFWYVALVGGGVNYWQSLSKPGRDIPDQAWGISGFVGLPFPVYRAERGSVTLLPYARPGLRFAGDGNVQGHHEVGVRLSWTSYRF